MEFGARSANIVQDILKTGSRSQLPVLKGSRSLRGIVPETSGGYVFGIYISDPTKPRDLLARLLGGLRAFDNHLGQFPNLVFNSYFISNDGWIVINPPKWVNLIEDRHDFEKDVFFSTAGPEGNPARGAVFTRLYYDDIWEKWMTSLITPVYVDNEFLGVVGHDILIEELVPFFFSENFGEDGTLIMVNRENELVLHPDILPLLQGRGFKMNEPLNLGKRVRDPHVRALLENLKRGKLRDGFANLSGERFHLWSSVVPGTGWKFIYMMSSRKILKRFQPRLERTLLRVVGVTLACVLLVLILLQLGVFLPLKRLNRGLSAIQTGAGDVESLKSPCISISRILDELFLNTRKVVQRLTINVREVEEARDYIESLMKTVRVFIAVLDENLMLKDINDFGLEKLKIRREEIQRLEMEKLFGSGELGNLTMELHSRGHVTNREMAMYLPDGRTINVDASISSEVNSQGVLSGYIAVFSDITLRKKAEGNLRNQISFSRQIFKTIPDMILITDMQQKVIFMNQKAEGLLKKRLSPNRALSDILSPLSLESGFDEYLRNSIREGNDIKQINVANPFLEEENFVDLVIEPLRTHSGVIGALILVRDITEWRDLTQKLQNLQTLMQKLINASPYAIISMGEDNRISVWNDSAEELFDTSAEDALGMPIFEVCPAFRNYRDVINEVKILNKTVFLNDEMMLLEGDKHLIVHLNIYPVQSEGRSVVINVQDVTEIKQLENSLMQAQKMESLGLLTSGIIHDFNNVLSGIMGYASLLDKKVDEQSGLKRYIRAILNSSDRASMMIQQILEYSRKKLAKREIIPLKEIVEESLEFLSPHLRNINVVLEEAGKGIFVHVDRTRISQVLINLLVNARDALKGRENPTLEVMMSREKVQLNESIPEGTYAVIRIRDNGRGIRPEHLDRIFEPFFTTKSRLSGTGIGLATVREIITDYNGEILVESEFEKGATFSVYLPESREAAGPPQEAVSVETPPMVTGWALLIDDEAVVREIGTDMLHSLGIKCLTAQDGEEGIRLFRENLDQVSFVILDIEMPGISGDQVFEELKKIRPKVKVLFASGYSREYLESKYFDQRITHFMAKPFQLSQLSRKIHELMNEEDAGG